MVELVISELASDYMRQVSQEGDTLHQLDVGIWLKRTLTYILDLLSHYDTVVIDAVR